MSNMEIDYPDRMEVEEQKRIILSKGLREPDNLLQRIKRMYYGPGFSVLFYQCSSAWIVGIMAYIFILAVSIFLQPAVLYKEFLGLMVSPILYLAFSMIYHLTEEEDAVIELKKTLKYSFSHLVTLRMFWVSIFSVLVNLVVFALEGVYFGDAWVTAMLGISSMFIFSILALYLYDSFGKRNHTLLITGVWVALCWILAENGGGLHHILFQVIPLALHVVVAICCFIGLVVYIRKVGFKNAYA